MITQQKRRQLLWAANAALAACLVASIALALWPLDLGPTKIPKRSNMSASGPAVEPTLKEPEAYAVLYRSSLRRPLYDPPPTATAPFATTAPVMAFRLTGTILDEDPRFSYAVFRSATGEPKMVAVGDSIDGAEVLEIGSTWAKVRFAGREVTLNAPKEDGGR